MSASANRLERETSPYLLQHAHNPVDWYPWGDEALGRARVENKPILLSVGYSACHWCHVMERESFEDERIAALMNEHFVNIKVDREERPDVDTIYMNAVQMLTGSGGWPLTVFLTPDAKPFFGGTYFPPEDRHGRPGFPRVLLGIAKAFHESPDDVATNVRQLMDGLAKISHYDTSDDPLDPALVHAAADKLIEQHDRENGGIGRAPKFPNVPAFRLFARRFASSGSRDMLEAFTLTLSRMAHGGMYDQLGGGFHRYSVDDHWLVPHFEKMLYDNAQLAPLYFEGAALTGEPLFLRIGCETLDYLLREMRHDAGGFFSTQDADTEGEEGKTYLWKPEQIVAALGPENGDIVCRYYQVDEVGNFAEPGQAERQSILNVKLPISSMAKLFGKTEDEIEQIISTGRSRLLEIRDERVQPGRDDKILTSWNALAIRALVAGWNATADQRYLDAARDAARFIESHLRNEEGRLLRTWKDDQAKYDAYLDDHAYLAAARLDLFEATGDPDDLTAARSLCDRLRDSFLDPEAGGFFFTAADHEQLIHRSKNVFDGSLPSGNAVAIEAFLRLAHLTGEDGYRTVGEQGLRLFHAQMQKQPFGCAYLLGVLEDHLLAPVDVVIVGPRDRDDTRALYRAAHTVHLPRASITICDPDSADDTRPPAARQRTMVDEKAAAWVCRNFACEAPVTSASALAESLRGMLAGQAG